MWIKENENEKEKKSISPKENYTLYSAFSWQRQEFFVR